MLLTEITNIDLIYSGCAMCTSICHDFGLTEEIGGTWERTSPKVMVTETRCHAMK